MNVRLQHLLLLCLLTTPLLSAQTWTVAHRDREIRLDGQLDEWQGVSGLTLEPGETPAEGQFGEGDVSLTLRALWDEESLYLALEWHDNVWDLEEIRRRDSVYVTPDKRRRDRMLFFDYLRFHLRRLNYDYLLWFSPRANEEGPFYWHRLLRGKSSMEAAANTPVFTPRQEAETATMEVRFYWKELQLNPKQLTKNAMPLNLLLSDSDAPDQILDLKLPNLKSLEWRGNLRLAKK